MTHLDVPYLAVEFRGLINVLLFVGSLALIFGLLVWNFERYDNDTHAAWITAGELAVIFLAGTWINNFFFGS